MIEVYAAVYTLFATTGLTLLRRALGSVALTATMTNPLFFVGGICYATSFGIFLWSLRHFDVLTVYPLFSGLGYAGVTGCAVLFLGERLHLGRIVGVALVGVAVVLLGR